MDRNVCPCPARQIAKVAEIFQFSRLLPRPSAASRLLKYLATRVGRARPRQDRAFRREPERRGARRLRATGGTLPGATASEGQRTERNAGEGSRSGGQGLLRRS